MINRQNALKLCELGPLSASPYTPPSDPTNTTTKAPQHPSSAPHSLPTAAKTIHPSWNQTKLQRPLESNGWNLSRKPETSALAFPSLQWVGAAPTAGSGNLVQEPQRERVTAAPFSLSSPLPPTATGARTCRPPWAPQQAGRTRDSQNSCHPQDMPMDYF